MSTKPTLALYQFQGCPFCTRVVDAIDELGVDVELRDIARDAEHYRGLIEATGRQMVPCLRIEAAAGDVQWLHESADIIDYLERIA